MESLLSQCTAVFAAHQPVLWALFLGGLTGGFTHCLAMCGAFSACESACGGTKCAKVTTAAKWQQRLNLPHHLGRMVSYGTLGLIAALMARQIAAYAFWPKLAAAMLILAGVMFLASSLSGFLQTSHHSAHALLSRLPTRSVRGALLGFLPCGLIYAALMVVAATANPWIGFFGMVAFVLGTLPALWLANLGVALLARQWREGAATLGRVMMAINGIALLAVAHKLVT